MLRGAAILLLLLGHFVLFCVKGAFFFEAAGNWAVMIFLFISGVALTKNMEWTTWKRDFSEENKAASPFYLDRPDRILYFRLHSPSQNISSDQNCIQFSWIHYTGPRTGPIGSLLTSCFYIYFIISFQRLGNRTWDESRFCFSSPMEPHSYF